MKNIKIRKSSLSDEADGTEDEWEQVGLNENTHSNTEISTPVEELLEKDVDLDASISFTVEGKKKRQGITKKDKEEREHLHKAYTICYILHLIYLNKLCDDHDIHASILSWLPPQIINDFWAPSRTSKAASKDLLLGKIERLAQYWNDYFKDEGEDVDQEIAWTFEYLRKCSADFSGPLRVKKVLFVSCCRALSIGTRLIYPLNSISLKFSLDNKQIKKRKITPSKTQFWTEIFVPPVKRWCLVPWFEIDCIDKPELLEDRLLKEINVSYIFALEPLSDRVKDVTKKYLKDVVTSTKKQRIDPWISAILEKCFSAASFDNAADDAENEEIRNKEKIEIIPSTISGFLNHPRYVLERNLKKYEYIHPKTQENIIGQIRGENIYPRSLIHTLHTSDKWLSLEGRIVKENEEPLKQVKSRAVSQTKERNRITKLGMEEDDGTESSLGMVGLYGIWQTEPFVPAPIVNGIIPKNKYNNIDLFKPSMCPPGAIHLKEDSIIGSDEKEINAVDIRIPSLKKVARSLDIDFAEAVVGFEYHGGRSVPNLQGIVVAVENEIMVREEFIRLLFEQIDKSRNKKELEIVQRWSRLVRKALIRLRLRNQFGNLDE